MSTPLYVSPTSAAIDEVCPRARYWHSFYGGEGIEPCGLDLNLLLGSLVHQELAALLRQEPLEPPLEEARCAIHTAIEGREWPLLLPDEVICMERELILLAEGMLWGVARWVWPRLQEEYEILSVEEMGSVAIGEHLGLRARPDVILKAKDGQIPGLGYVEFKTTGSVAKSWLDHWERSPQVWAASLVVPPSQGKRLEWFMVQGLYKGQVRYGKRSSPLCYGWYCPPMANLPAQWSYEEQRRKGWIKSLVSEYPGGSRAWMNGMPEEILSQQFPQTLPSMIDEQLRDRWLRQLCQREETRWAWRESGAAEDEATLEATFPQHFSQCQPAWGHACQFLKCCHQPVVGSDPVGSGLFRMRVA